MGEGGSFGAWPVKVPYSTLGPYPLQGPLLLQNLLVDILLLLFKHGGIFLRIAEFIEGSLLC